MWRSEQPQGGRVFATKKGVRANHRGRSDPLCAIARDVRDSKFSAAVSRTGMEVRLQGPTCGRTTAGGMGGSKRKSVRLWMQEHAMPALQHAPRYFIDLLSQPRDAVNRMHGCGNLDSCRRILHYSTITYKKTEHPLLIITTTLLPAVPQVIRIMTIDRHSSFL